MITHWWVIVHLVVVVGGDNSDQLHLLHSSASKKVIFHKVVVDNNELVLKLFFVVTFRIWILNFQTGESGEFLYIFRTCAAGLIRFSYFVPFSSFLLMTLQVALVAIWNQLLSLPSILIVVNRIQS